MPTIEFAYKDFENLLGKKIPVKEFEELVLLFAKGESEGYNKTTDHIKISLDDTNTPYMWCAEGMARYMQGVLELKSGIAPMKIQKSKYKINVDESVKKIRPAIATFVADGKAINDYLLEQLIQLQEKYCDSYGRRRQKVSIGLYSYKRITWPVHYTTTAPDESKFIPLEMDKPITPKQVLELHPKGKLHRWILKDFKRYPMLKDDKGEVLSLVPVINSNFTGKLEVGDSQILFEATGTDQEAVDLAANIFAQNLYDRGFTIHSVTVQVGSKKRITPYPFNETIKVDKAVIDRLLGMELSEGQIKNLLERARYNVKGNEISIPNYRRDILHPVDIGEDAAIMFGYNSMEGTPLTSYTVGTRDTMIKFADEAREICVGMGFQEILSPILSNLKFIEERMNTSGTGALEIENVMSETYSAVRTWITPNLMEVFSKNKHNDYPQKIFEEGIVNIREGDNIIDMHTIALGISHTNADFTEIKQNVDVLMKSLGIEYSIERSNHNSFIEGRGGNITVAGKKLGIIGEISPEVLTNWELEMPTAVAEIDLTQLRKLTS